MKFDLTTIILSGIAAFIGSVISIIAVYFAHKWEVKRQQKNEERLVLDFFRRFMMSLKLLWRFIKKNWKQIGCIGKWKTIINTLACNE